MSVKIYPTGTVVSTPARLKPIQRNETSFNRSTGKAAKRKQVYNWHFQAREKVRAAIIHNHFLAGEDPGLVHAFLTCTLRGGRDLHGDYGLIDGGRNSTIKRFTKNLVKTYECRSYTWVRELTKAGVPHWHVSCVMPWIDIRILNKAWVAARGGDFHPFALRSGFDQRSKRFRMEVNSLQAAMAYVSPYMSKDGVKDSPDRLYGIGGPCKPPKPATEDLWGLLAKAMREDETPYVGEYATLYRLKYPNLAYLFCQKMTKIDLEKQKTA
jgi:hypothetical protein